jgi:hypothetical protein
MSNGMTSTASTVVEPLSSDHRGHLTEPCHLCRRDGGRPNSEVDGFS